jgi:endonuclease-3
VVVIRQAGSAVARKTPGPRQPLSQARPKAARGVPGVRPIVAAPRQKGPPTSKVRAPSKKPVTTATQGKAGKRAPRRVPAGELPAHARTIYERLSALYPDAHCELDYGDAWQLLQATILSAQCTDKRVNMVTPTLFRTYPTPATLAAAPQESVEEIIRTTGFFRNKARNLIAMAGAVDERHGGQVPPSMDDLVKLPGVGRKTANVVLGNACNINEGVVVDTHVQRLSLRLGLTRETDPEKIERVLMALYERQQWTLLSHLLIWHGRRVCEARKPRCGECVLNDICPSAFRI